VFDTYGLFPVPISIANLENAMTNAESAKVFDLETRRNHGNNITTNNYILDLPEFQNLKSKLQNALEIYFKKLYSNKNATPYITQSWINYTSTNDYHHVHTHTNSIFSGVFYIQTLEQDKIYFYKDSLPVFDFTEDKNYNLYTSLDWHFPVKNNDLIVFPSNIRLSVEQNQSDITRISLAFNTYVKGSVGEASGSNKLEM